MAFSPAAVSTILSQHKQDVGSLESRLSAANANPYLIQLDLRKIWHGLPQLLSALESHKSSKLYKPVHSELLSLSNSVDELLFKARKALDDEFARQRSVSETTQLESEQQMEELKTEDKEELSSLRKRLLADGTSTSLDNKDVSTDQNNDYHESFQEDIMKDLTGLASALKSSALSLSSKIVEDTKLLSSTNENMLKSLSLMQSVGSNLNGYLNNKTGGKISLFFIIKTMVFVFLLFFFMIVIIKILPRM